MVTIQREPFHPFFEDSQPLLEKHWREIARYLDIPLKPDVGLYEASEEMGGLYIYTVRGTDRQLYGYAVFFVRLNGHYSTSLQAVQDIVFIDPQFRQGALGIKLLRYAENDLRQNGVQVVYHHVKLAHPALGRILERQGYEPVETIYSKRLDGV